MSLKSDRVTFIRFIDDDAIETLYDCDYRISNDTLVLFNCYYYMFYGKLHDTNFYYFKIIEDGILESLSFLSDICKKGEMFYCTMYHYKSPETLVCGSHGWKNGKKNGVWIYFDSIGNVYNLIYENDVVKERIFIKESYLSNLLIKKPLLISQHSYIQAYKV